MKQLDFKEVSKIVKKDGYVRIENFLTPSEAVAIEKEMRGINNTYYNENNLINRLCYLREDSKNRQGDAYNVSLERNEELPSIVLPSSLIRDCLNVYLGIVSTILNKETPVGLRTMLNCQQYFEKSLPVFQHYDGEFFDFTHSYDEKTQEKTMILNKGLLPRYVMVIVLRNENTNGTYIQYHDSNDRIDIPNNAYDLILFDNINMRHGVPELENPRMMIGFRSFDFYPYLFESLPTDVRGFEELYDLTNPGFIKEIDLNEANIIQKEFIHKWKTELHIEQLKLAPAF